MNYQPLDIDALKRMTPAQLYDQLSACTMPADLDLIRAELIRRGLPPTPPEFMA